MVHHIALWLVSFFPEKSPKPERRLGKYDGDDPRGSVFSTSPTSGRTRSDPLPSCHTCERGFVFGLPLQVWQECSGEPRELVVTEPPIMDGGQ